MTKLQVGVIIRDIKRKIWLKYNDVKIEKGFRYEDSIKYEYITY